MGFVLTTEWVGSKSFVKSLLCGWVVRKWRMLECVKVWRRRVRANNVFSAHLTAHPVKNGPIRKTVTWPFLCICASVHLPFCNQNCRSGCWSGFELVRNDRSSRNNKKSTEASNAGLGYYPTTLIQRPFFRKKIGESGGHHADKLKRIDL